MNSPLENKNSSPHLSQDAYTLNINTILSELNTTHSGLSQKEADIRLKKHGRNILPQTTNISFILIFIRQFIDPFIYILLAAVFISLLLGEHTDAAFIFTILLINAVIGSMQEHGAEKSAISLREFIPEYAHVIRDDEALEINAVQLVPGDIILLQSGDKIPADIRLITSHDLQIDESLLTGESTPVTKDSSIVLSEPTLVADQLNISFKGTLVLKGRAEGVVTTTGLYTQLGQIAEAVIVDKDVKPPLVTRMESFTINIAIAIGITVILIGIAMFYQGHSMQDIFFIVVALAVAAIPEGLPVALTVALAIGVRRMAKRYANLGRSFNVLLLRIVNRLTCKKAPAFKLKRAVEDSHALMRNNIYISV